MGSVGVMELRDTYGISGVYGMKRYVWDQWGLRNEDTYGISGGYGMKRYVWDQWGLWNEDTYLFIP